MSENQDKSTKAKHTLKKMKASEQIHSQLTKEKDPNEKQLPIILTNEDSTAIQIEDKESKDLVHVQFLIQFLFYSYMILVKYLKNQRS